MRLKLKYVWHQIFRVTMPRESQRAVWISKAWMVNGLISIQFAFIPIFGHWSDKASRKRSHLGPNISSQQACFDSWISPMSYFFGLGQESLYFCWWSPDYLEHLWPLICVSSFCPSLKDGMWTSSSMEPDLTLLGGSHTLTLIRRHRRSSQTVSIHMLRLWPRPGGPVLSWVLLPAAPLFRLALRLPVPSPRDLLEAVQVPDVPVHATPAPALPQKICPIPLLASLGHLTSPQLITSPPVLWLY